MGKSENNSERHVWVCLPHEVSSRKSDAQDSYQREIPTDSKKTGKTQTYNTEELENLNTYLDEMYA